MIFIFLRRSLFQPSVELAFSSLRKLWLLVREGRQHDASHIKYVGFELPPAFVVGYGLDAGEYGRNLPYVAEHIQ